MAAVLVATPAAGEPRGYGGPYVGVQYDQGGIVRPIAGRVPEVRDLAERITRQTEQMLRELADERARLPYGGLERRAHHHELTVYPAPAGISPSDQYAVTVRQGRTTRSSFVYKVDARKRDTNVEEDTSWTSFSFAGRVSVSVRKLQGEATGCLVRPASARIRTRFADGVCSFTLTRPANVSVEFAPNTTNPVLHPMLVFANPPEADIPPIDDPNVLYFGPGVHSVGAVQLHSNQTVYVAGGAWVQAHFKGVGVHDVVIRGRGIVDGTFLDKGNGRDNRFQPGLVDIDCHEPGEVPHSPCSATANSRNIVVEGVTFVNGPRFNVRVLGDHITVSNIKVMSWWFKTDCIWAGNVSLIEGNFCKVNDDTLKPMTGPSVIRHNVIWQLEDGSAFQLSYNLRYDQADFHIYDNDVIHDEHYPSPRPANARQAIFAALHAGPATMQRYLFEHIRIEDADWRLFNIRLENNNFYDPALGYGQISDLIFRDITAQRTFREPNAIAGIEADHRVANVSLIDVYANGGCIRSAADGNLEIDPATTDQIRIMTSAPGCHAGVMSR
jgi:hypothetical protein